MELFADVAIVAIIPKRSSWIPFVTYWLANRYDSKALIELLVVVAIIVIIVILARMSFALPREGRDSGNSKANRVSNEAHFMAPCDNPRELEGGACGWPSPIRLAVVHGTTETRDTSVEVPPLEMRGPQ